MTDDRVGITAFPINRGPYRPLNLMHDQTTFPRKKIIPLRNSFIFDWLLNFLSISVFAFLLTHETTKRMNNDTHFDGTETNTSSLRWKRAAPDFPRRDHRSARESVDRWSNSIPRVTRFIYNRAGTSITTSLCIVCDRERRSGAEYCTSVVFNYTGLLSAEGSFGEGDETGCQKGVEHEEEEE